MADNFFKWPGLIGEGNKVKEFHYVPLLEDADLEEVYNTERHLLYVACTRARDYLLVTSGNTPSEFLDDLRM